jgi:hypothetical protein
VVENTLNVGGLAGDKKEKTRLSNRGVVGDGLGSGGKLRQDGLSGASRIVQLVYLPTKSDTL